jgi:hypothetical protein
VTLTQFPHSQWGTPSPQPIPPIHIYTHHPIYSPISTRQGARQRGRGRRGRSDLLRAPRHAQHHVSRGPWLRGPLLDFLVLSFLLSSRARFAHRFAAAPAAAVAHRFTARPLPSRCGLRFRLALIWCFRAPSPTAGGKDGGKDGGRYSNTGSVESHCLRACRPTFFFTDSRGPTSFFNQLAFSKNIAFLGCFSQFLPVFGLFWIEMFTF